MYTVKEGSLYMGARKLGDKETIYVDGHQDVAGYVKRSSSKGYSVVQLKEGDYIMVTPSGLTVGIEEKKPSDLSNSIRNRRIQRQLRTLEGMVDIQTQHHSLGPIPQPSDLHKEGIKLELWLPKSTSDGSPLREFSHTAAGVKNAINDLHTAWERGAENVDPVEREAGEIVPLVKVAVDSFKTKNGTFQKPVFTIAGWGPRRVEWSIPMPVAAAPAAPQMADAAAGGSFVEGGGAAGFTRDQMENPAADDDLPF